MPDEHQQTTPPDQLTQAPSPAEDAPDAAAQESAEARRKREQWERDHAQWLRERDETRREMFTLFKIWTICPHKNCQRARACRAVDTEECRRDRWRHVITDEMRFMLSRMGELASEGHPAHDIARLARAEWDEKQKAWAGSRPAMRTAWPLTPRQPMTATTSRSTGRRRRTRCRTNRAPRIRRL